MALGGVTFYLRVFHRIVTVLNHASENSLLGLVHLITRSDRDLIFPPRQSMDTMLSCRQAKGYLLLSVMEKTEEAETAVISGTGG